MSKAMRALVLSGGGSRGAYQAGAWQALAETGWVPDLIVGTSVGAINGAMIAMRLSPQEIRDYWCNLRQKDLLRNRIDIHTVGSWRGFYDASSMRRLFEENVDLERLHRGIPMKVHAVCLEDGQEAIWDTPELTIDHFMATAALMPGLPPVAIGEHHYADGGHWGALPLRHALEAGARDVHVLLHDPLAPHEAPLPTSIREIIRRQSDIVWHGRQHAEWESLQARMDLPRRHPWRLPKADVMFHAPTPPLETEILKFDPGDAQRLFDMGHDQTRARLQADTT